MWGNHDDNFHALNRQLNKDVISLDWTTHGAKTLGSGEYYNPEDDEEEEMENDITYEAGTYRLGAGSKSNHGDDTPEANRQQRAAAALMRLTKQEKEMDDACGSSGSNKERK